MYETIELSIKNHIAWVHLNRPDSLNSINKTMLKELSAALDVVKDSARVLVISGKGKGFCSGQDLSERKLQDSSMNIDLGESLEKHYNPLMLKLFHLPIPSIAIVNGVAAGAGVALALANDIVLMSSSASLVLAFSKIGLVPDSGSSWLLANSIGYARAKVVSMLGERISAHDALQWGIAWKVFDEIELQSQANEFAQKLASMPTKGLGFIKRSFNEVSLNDFTHQLELEKNFQRLAGRTHDYQEGVYSFLEKRKPNFAGK